MTTLQSNLTDEELMGLIKAKLTENPNLFNELEKEDPLITRDLLQGMDQEFRESVKTHTNELNHMGHTILYNTRDGKPSKVLTSMAGDYRRQRFQDGSPVWSDRPQPNTRQPEGTHYCVLHKDAPERAHFDAIGWNYHCVKAAFRSPMRRDQHVQRFHKQTWGLMQRERQEEDRGADRSQREALTKVLEMLAERETPSSRRGREQNSGERQ